MPSPHPGRTRWAAGPRRPTGGVGERGTIASAAGPRSGGSTGTPEVIVSAPALPTPIEAPVVVTVDLHRGHLDADVATLPLPDGAADALMDRVVPALDAFRHAGLPVVHVVTRYRTADEALCNPFAADAWGGADGHGRALASHNVGAGPGDEVMPGVLAVGDLIVGTKKRHDAFHGTDLDVTLRALRARTVVLVGVGTDSGVLATAAAASARDLAVVVCADLTASVRGEQAHDAALLVLAGSFAAVAPAAAVLAAVAPAEEAPSISAEDERMLHDPDLDYPADASPEALDRAQFRQGAAMERLKAWVDPHEFVGGED